MKELSPIWQRIQGTLFPFLREELDPITEKEQKLVAILEVVRIEDHIRQQCSGFVGRPRADRQALARAFVLKAYYNIPTTAELIERIRGTKNLRRICGWERRDGVPDESTFSRAFEEFSESKIVELGHAELISKHESKRLVGHISRDSTEIVAREKPVSKPESKNAVEKSKRKKGRPKKGEVVAPKPPTALERQKEMSLAEILESLPKPCDRGTKKNSKGYGHSWNGYKLHIDTADGEIPISCVLTSASVHDSQVALPLAKLTAERVTSLYDLMDAAYDAEIIKEHSKSLGHVPIIDANRRRGEKLEMEPASKVRYKCRTSAERVNARLKDDLGGRHVRVRGNPKVMAHLMFGILALTAEQLLRLVT